MAPTEHSTPGPPSYAWETFLSRAGRATIPSLDPLYALPPPLVDLIRQHVPSLWDRDELKLELSLAETAGGGFFHRQPFEVVGPQAYILRRDFPFPAMPPDQFAAIASELESRVKYGGYENAADRNGKNEAAAKRRLAEIESFVRADDEMQIGFAGWLVTNPEFMGMLEGLKASAPQTLLATHLFPMLPPAMPFLVEGTAADTGAWQPQSQDDREFFYYWVVVCNFWCLQSLSTWDIPVPIRCSPLLHDPDFAPTIQPNLQEGMSFGSQLISATIPAYMLKHDINVSGRLKVRLNRTGSRDVPSLSFLHGWTESGKGPGKDVCSNMLRLYVYWELALVRRYGSRLRGKTEALDRAFGKFLYLDRDTVKSYRKLMNKRRKGAKNQQNPKDAKA